MNGILNKVKIDTLFFAKSGDYHATKELDAGDIPLISCGNVENGLVGYFDIPQDKCYHHCITVAYNGQPLLAKFHPYNFGAKDDVAVLQPRLPMSDTTLLYIAAQLNNAKWRYSYGRKCFRGKLQNVEIFIPIKNDSIDQESIDSHFNADLQQLLPERIQSNQAAVFPTLKWYNIRVHDLFEIKRGDFHSLAALDPGQYRTVSRIAIDNGTKGYFDFPEKAELYPRGRITISTVGGDAFVQLSDFIATDNVLILIPRSPMKSETLFFISFALNRQKWRYSYGRQCYKAKFTASTKIWLPVTDNSRIDEASIKIILENTSYWSQINTALGNMTL